MNKNNKLKKNIYFSLTDRRARKKTIFLTDMFVKRARVEVKVRNKQSKKGLRYVKYDINFVLRITITHFEKCTFTTYVHTTSINHFRTCQNGRGGGGLIYDKIMFLLTFFRKPFLEEEPYFCIVA